jgi:hypothetical protein
MIGVTLFYLQTPNEWKYKIIKKKIYNIFNKLDIESNFEYIWGFIVACKTTLTSHDPP